MALLRFKIGVIFTPGGKPGETPAKVKEYVASVFPRSQEPADLEACEHEAQRVQNALYNLMTEVQANTGAFGSAPAFGTFRDPVRDV